MLERAGSMRQRVFATVGSSLSSVVTLLMVGPCLVVCVFVASLAVSTPTALMRALLWSGVEVRLRSGWARIWPSASESAARVLDRRRPAPRATTRSGRTRIAPSSAIWRSRSHEQRGSYRSPSRCPIRTASSGSRASAASSRAASHHGSPFSPAISSNRPGATRSLIAWWSPSSSSTHACGRGAPGRVPGSLLRTRPKIDKIVNDDETDALRSQRDNSYVNPACGRQTLAPARANARTDGGRGEGAVRAPGHRQHAHQ